MEVGICFTQVATIGWGRGHRSSATEWALAACIDPSGSAPDGLAPGKRLPPACSAAARLPHSRPAWSLDAVARRGAPATTRSWGYLSEADTPLKVFVRQALDQHYFAQRSRKAS